MPNNEACAFQIGAKLIKLRLALRGCVSETCRDGEYNARIGDPLLSRLYLFEILSYVGRPSVDIELSYRAALRP